jgi:hypothetical protein
VTLKFVRSVDKHGVPRKSTWHVIMSTQGRDATTSRGERGKLYIGVDDRGIELEVMTRPTGPFDEIVFHSMPTSDRHQED